MKYDDNSNCEINSRVISDLISFSKKEQNYKETPSFVCRVKIGW